MHQPFDMSFHPDGVFRKFVDDVVDRLADELHCDLGLAHVADHVLCHLPGVKHDLEVGVAVVDDREEHVVAVDPGIVAA